MIGMGMRGIGIRIRTLVPEEEALGQEQEQAGSSRVEI
jgi:hypothetical protein